MGEVAEAVETARKADGGDRSTLVRRLQHASRVLQAYVPEKGHRRTATGLAECLEHAADAHTGRLRQSFNGDQPAPVCGDVLFDDANLPGCGAWRAILQQMTEIMGVGDQK